MVNKLQPSYSTEEQKKNLFDEYRNRTKLFEASANEFIKTVTIIASWSIAFGIPILVDEKTINLINSTLFKFWMFSFVVTIVTYVLLNLASLWNEHTNIHIIKDIIVELGVDRISQSTKPKKSISGTFFGWLIDNSTLLMIANLIFFITWIVLLFSSVM